jgi:hypothetical protein
MVVDAAACAASGVVWIKMAEAVVGGTTMSSIKNRCEEVERLNPIPSDVCTLSKSSQLISDEQRLSEDDDEQVVMLESPPISSAEVEFPKDSNVGRRPSFLNEMEESKSVLFVGKALEISENL